MSPAGAEIPGLTRCEALTFSIPVKPWLLKQERFDDAVRESCTVLSANGVANFIHFHWDERNPHNQTLVELFNPAGLFAPHINYITNSVELREHSLCE